MSNRTHQLAVLHDGTATHSLHDTACFFEQFAVGNVNYHSFVPLGSLTHRLYDFYIVASACVVIQSAVDLRFSQRYFGNVGYVNQFVAKRGQTVECAECTVLVVDVDVSQAFFKGKTAFQFACGTFFTLFYAVYATIENSAVFARYNAACITNGMPQTAEVEVFSHIRQSSYSAGRISCPQTQAVMPRSQVFLGNDA